MKANFAVICVLYGLLMSGGVFGATSSPTPPPSPSLAPTSAPTDEKVSVAQNWISSRLQKLTRYKQVGTPFAPTTPGGACLNDNDYKDRWTAVIKDGLTGFDLFAKDMEV